VKAIAAEKTATTGEATVADEQAAPDNLVPAAVSSDSEPRGGLEGMVEQRRNGAMHGPAERPSPTPRS
jgi:hypothetical protein